MYASIIVPLRLPVLTYRVPSGMDLKPGDPVKVRVRKKVLDGVVLDLQEKVLESKFEIRDIDSTSEDFPFLHSDCLKILKWASEYYHYPIGDVLRSFLPPDPAPRKKDVFVLTAEGEQRYREGKLPKGIVQKSVLEKAVKELKISLSGNERAAAKKLIEKNWLRMEEVHDEALPEPPPPTSSPLALNVHQGNALSRICSALDKNAFEPFLLQGVTGSGKTEVYLRAAEYTLRKNRSVLVVVPEISLTPQLVARFKARLGERIAVLHSGISDGERSHQWHMLNRGLVRVCIGARSASFAPIRDLGLVIVDEEHDSALKQEDHLKYSARDLAIVRAKFGSCPIILGSATPSLESYHNAHNGKYQHLLLPERAAGQQLPDVIVVDRSKTDPSEQISPYLRKSIQEALDSKGQVMLLLNRRGFSSFLICKDCGNVPNCPNCSVSLTNYKTSKILKCHYCDHNEPIPSFCYKCESTSLFPGILGTESLEEEVKNLFPQASVLRIDRESTERKGALEQALASISKGEVDIVIGTQIIAKGHDFPNISLVGVVNADSSFHLPDFRASEKSFQLFTQMAGRAGRAERAGKVIIQTFNPKHPSIVHATQHDYRSFAEEELGFRLAFQYPPYTRMVRILVSAPSAQEAEVAAEKLGRLMEKPAQAAKIELVGPAPAALTKVQNRYRWNILLKCTNPGALHSLLTKIIDSKIAGFDHRVHVQVDVDPVSLM